MTKEERKLKYEFEYPNGHTHHSLVPADSKRLKSILWANKHNKDAEYIKYRNWRRAIVHKYKVCSQCLSDKELEAHHQLPIRLFPEYRYEKWNGLLLCHTCHKLTDSYSGKVFSKRTSDYKISEYKKK